MKTSKYVAFVAAFIMIIGGVAIGTAPAEAAGPSPVPSLSVPPDPIGPGQVVSTGVTITNTGDAASSAGTVRTQWVTSSLPAQFSVTGASGNCTITTVRSTKTATCSYPALAPGESFLTAVMTVTAPNPVPYSGVDFTSTWNTSYGNAAVTYHMRGSGPADLSTALTVTPLPMVTGKSVTAAIAIDNYGYGDATGFVTRVTLPTGATGVTINKTYGAATCTSSGDVIDCVAGAFGGGARLLMNVNFTAPSSVGSSPLTVSADPANLIVETNENNNTKTTPVNVSVAITTPAPVSPGQTASADLTATNSGTEVSVPGVVTLKWTRYLPTGTTVTLSAAPAGCTVTAPLRKTYYLATCTLPAIAPGATIPITTVNMNSATAPSAGISVKVDVAGPTNTASSLLVIRQDGLPDLSASISISPTVLYVGGRATASARVTNPGYAAAGPFVTRIALPAGATNIVPIAPIGTDCVIDLETVICNTAALGAGLSMTLSVAFDASTSGSFTASIATDVDDTVAESNETNNTAASNTLTVNGTAANLTTAVANPMTPVAQGAMFTRTLTVSNIGNAEALGVTLADASTEFNFVSASGPIGTTCSSWYQTMQFNKKVYKGTSCTIGTIPAGGSASVDLVLSVPPTRAAGNYIDTLTGNTTSFKNPAMNAVSTGSTTVYVPSAPLPPTNLTVPAVTGTLVQGNSVATSNGTWLAATSYAYKWQRCDSNGDTCADIAGATASSYVLSALDAGFTLRSTVTASNAGGSTAATSAASGVVTAPSVLVNTIAPALVPGEDWPGTVWGVTSGTWTGTAPITYAYQWQSCDLEGQNCADIAGATNSNYLLTAAEIDHTVQARVTATNTGGSASALSDRSGEIAAQ